MPLRPLLRGADWRRLRSRHVRLLCCGLGDGVCLREEVETWEEEEEGEEAREAGDRAPLAFALSSAAREYPLAHAAPRAFPLLTAPPLFSQDAWVPGVELGPEPGRGETWLWPRVGGWGPSPSPGSPPPRHFWGVRIRSSPQGGGSAPSGLPAAPARARQPRRMRWCRRLPALARPLRRRVLGGR